MTEQESIRLYAELLWWFLIILACGGISIAAAGIAAMIFRIRMMDDLMRSALRTPAPPPVPMP